jgi:hypothetical protein
MDCKSVLDGMKFRPTFRSRIGKREMLQAASFVVQRGPKPPSTGQGREGFSANPVILW